MRDLFLAKELKCKARELETSNPNQQYRQGFKDGINSVILVIDEMIKGLEAEAEEHYAAWCEAQSVDLFGGKPF